MQALTRISVVVERLADGRVWAERPDRPLYPASMIKLPLAAAALLLAGRGVIDWETPVAISAANVTPGDTPSPFVAGYPAAPAELVAFAIEQSDNTAANELFDLVGRERATRLVRAELGLRDTAFRRKLSGGDPLLVDPEQTGRNAHPAADAARLFAAIARDEFPGARMLRDHLERQHWNTKLSRGLRPGDRFAHKTGDTQSVSHDGGILTTAEGEGFVVVAYSGEPSSDATDARFGELMEALRAFLERPT